MGNDTDQIAKLLEEAKLLSANRPKESYIVNNKAYLLAKEKNLLKEEGNALFGMSYACRVMSEYSRGLQHAFSALDIFQSIDDSQGQIRAYNLIGIIYFYFGQFEQALEYFLESSHLLQEHTDEFMLTSLINNIGEVYREAGHYDKALEYYNRALERSQRANFRVNTAAILTNIGEVHFNQHEYNKALEYFRQGYHILLTEQESLILAEIENNLGKSYVMLQDYQKAKEFYHSALYRLEKVNNKYYIIDVLVNLGKLEILQGRDKLYYIHQAMQAAEEIDAKKKLNQIYLLLSEHYEKAGSLKLALQNYKKYHFTLQEIEATNLGHKLKIIQIEFDHFKTDNQVQKFKKLNYRFKMEIEKEKKKLKELEQINKSLRQKALNDELTGIPNRRFVNDFLKRIWEQNKGQSIALYVIDIDDFKLINDYWGHENGDECLVKLAQSLQYIQRKKKDIFARYGGEEFIYISQKISFENASDLGKQLKISVEELGMKYTSEAASDCVTISVGGVYGTISDFESITDMIRIADDELYKAKNMGKNVFCMCNLVDKMSKTVFSPT